MVGGISVVASGVVGNGVVGSGVVGDGVVGHGQAASEGYGVPAAPTSTKNKSSSPKPDFHPSFSRSGCVGLQNPGISLLSHFA